MIEKEPNNILWNPKNSQTEGISIELSPLSDMNKILDQMEKQKDNTKILEKIILSVELHQDLIHAVNDQNINDANRQFALIGVLGTPIVIDENLKGKKWLPVYKEDFLFNLDSLNKKMVQGVEIIKLSYLIRLRIYLITLWRKIKQWFNS